MNNPRRMVVVDANAYWTEQLFWTLAPEWDVLLVKPRDIREYMRRHPAHRCASFVEDNAPGIRTLHMPVPPKFTTTLWPIARRLLGRAIAKAGGNRPDVLAICFPDYRDLFDTLKPRTALYYNYDDYAAHWPGRADELVAGEEATIARADLSVFIAKYRVDHLSERLPHLANRLHHIPIGVTPTFMDQGREVRPEPVALSGISHPRAGYVGTLSYRFDFPFFAEAAAAAPDVQFVLGGSPPAEGQGDSAWWRGVKRARTLPNVHFIGWVDHSALGDHLSHFDVLLMPYARCRFNDNACPAKLWDYLGTGLPVVANMNNPETLLWRDLIEVAESPNRFAEAIARVVRQTAGEATGLRARRLQIAREHTWERLGARLRRILPDAPIKPNDH
jgi:glycosyltransferase involved in cell wall biosynthesis